MQFIPFSDSPFLGKEKLVFPLRRTVPAGMRGQTLFFWRRFYFDAQDRAQPHDSDPRFIADLCHGQHVSCEWVFPPETGGYGSGHRALPCSLPGLSRTRMHISWVKSFRVLLAFPLAFGRLPACFTYFLFYGFLSHVCAPRTSLLTWTALRGLPTSCQWVKQSVFHIPHGLTGICCSVGTDGFSALILLTGLLTTFQTASILCLLSRFHSAFLYIWFSVDFFKKAFKN